MSETAQEPKSTYTFLMRFFVWIPLGLVGVGLVVWAVLAITSATSDAEAASKASTVDAAYASAGYSAPSYTTEQNQAQGVCSNIRSGGVDFAAAQFATGWNATPGQADQIVRSIQANLC